MKGSLIVVAFFALGCILGWLGSGDVLSGEFLPETAHIAGGETEIIAEGEKTVASEAPGIAGDRGDIPESGWLPEFLVDGSITAYVLYLLMLQVGISIGSDKKLKEILCSIKPKLLLVPVATIAGTLVFSALVSFFISKWSVFDCLAVGSGFAYYSLSSILITELKADSLGLQLATELATIALMANIMREIIALLGAPLFCKYFGKFAPISVGGATTMDTTLPIITRYCGKEMVFVSIFHGVLVDFTVPLFVSFFCSF